MKPETENQRKLREAIEKMEADRIAKGVCRHCGGAVPCWSPFGDRSVGVRYDERRPWRRKK